MKARPSERLRWQLVVRGHDAEGDGDVQARPALRRPEGARLTVTRFSGHLKPLEITAARTLSRDSRQDASGSPTTLNPGNPLLTWTSTVTGWPSTPTSVAEETVASIGLPPTGVRDRAGAAAGTSVGGQAGHEQHEQEERYQRRVTKSVPEPPRSRSRVDQPAHSVSAALASRPLSSLSSVARPVPRRRARRRGPTSAPLKLAELQEIADLAATGEPLGLDVRRIHPSQARKTYLCPGCQQEIAAGRPT